MGWFTQPFWPSFVVCWAQVELAVFDSRQRLQQFTCITISTRSPLDLSNGLIDRRKHDRSPVKAFSLSFQCQVSYLGIGMQGWPSWWCRLLVWGGWQSVIWVGPVCLLVPRCRRCPLYIELTHKSLVHPAHSAYLPHCSIQFRCLTLDKVSPLPACLPLCIK